MVGSGIDRKSSRPAIASAAIAGPNASASAMASSECGSSIPSRTRIFATSTLGSPGLPSTAMTVPSGFSSGESAAVDEAEAARVDAQEAFDLGAALFLLLLGEAKLLSRQGHDAPVEGEVVEHPLDRRVLRRRDANGGDDLVDVERAAAFSEQI